jgi:hypothetical protein
MNSRNYQNTLHLVGATSSLLTIFGAVLVGAGSYYGVILMLMGAIFTRLTSEIEFRKQTLIVGEKMRTLAKYLVPYIKGEKL